ncbi:MAG TPA: triose-phosphate isomerase [Rhizomicrobium sp.]
MRHLIAGNWKMNGTGQSLAEIEAIAAGTALVSFASEILICPPFTLVARAAALAKGRIAIGAQDCHPGRTGAFTGDISAEMLADAGATAVIVGHSERRRYHGETDALVAAKARAAWRAGLLAIICIGETDAQRQAGEAHRVISDQLAASVPPNAEGSTTAIAYEPIWAIGTGRTPSPSEIEETHARIRHHLVCPGERIRILYGGSVNPVNAQAILGLPTVDGALIGGASLRAGDFLAIAAACDPS